MAFEFLVYAIAIVTVLCFIAEPRTAAQPATESAPDESLLLTDEEVDELEKGQAVPFADAIVPFVRKSATVADFSDLLEIAPASHPVCVAGCGVHQLRTLGSLYEIKGARRWTKKEAVAQVLSYHAA